MATTTTRKVPPQVGRVLYRSCLRASRNGRFPEVFSSIGADVYNFQVSAENDHPTLAMPSTSVHVRQRLKAWFQSPRLDILQGASPFRVLPEILQQADALKLQTDPRAAKPSLLLLENNSIGALTGEYLQFSLSDQVQIDAFLDVATSRDDEASRFLLRRDKGETCNTAMELKVLSHRMTNDHNLVIACLAGSRVKVDLDWTHECRGSTVAESYHLLRDNLSDASDYPIKIRISLKL